MNRRELLGGMIATGAAAGLAPLVPGASVAASAAPAGSAAVAGNFTPYMHHWAVHHARSAGRISPAIISDMLGVKPEVARALTSRLIKQGVVGVPNALGLSRATNPFAAVSDAAPVNSFKAVDPVHAEYVEKSRLQEQLKKLASEDGAETTDEVRQAAGSDDNRVETEQLDKDAELSHDEVDVLEDRGQSDEDPSTSDVS